MDSRLVSLTSTAAFAAVIAGFVAVIADIAGWAVSPIVWAAIFAVYFGAQVHTLRKSGAIILAAAIILFVLVWAIGGEAHWDGFGRAGFLFIFLMVMQYMADLAGRSPKVSQAAEIVVSRPPGQRYLFVTYGTHVFGLFLQIGAVILIMSLLGERLKAAGEATARSLTIACLRGFASTAMWSPLSLGILIVFSNVSGVEYLHFIPFGIVMSALYLAAGYQFERGRRAQVRHEAPLARSEWAVLLRVVALAVLLVISGLTWVAVFEVELIEGMFTVVFLLGLAWTVISLVSGGLTIGVAAGQVRRAASSLANEVAIISGATIIGAVAAGMIAGWSGLQGAISPTMAATAALFIPAAIFSGGMVALNPVLTATIIASALNPVWPDAAKLWLVFSLTWGWAISASGTPFTANVLMAAQKVGKDGFTVAMRWNGTFTAAAMVTLSLIAAAGTFTMAN